MTSLKGKLFLAEATKGYIIKVLTDVLSTPLSRGYFIFTSKGIFLRHQDSGSVVLFDINLERSNFKRFKCLRTMKISVNLKHVQKLLKNVKKKDSITLFIDKSKLGRLGILIEPEGSKKTSRFETNYIVYQDEPDYEISDLPDCVYKNPIIIESQIFQKIKKLANIGKIITVKIQKSNYLAFESDAGNVYSSELGFGELLYGDDDEEEEEDLDNDMGLGNTTKIENAEEDEVEIVKEKDTEEEAIFYETDYDSTDDENETDDEREENNEEEDEDDDNEEEPKNLFKGQYYASILTLLIKLPGLCSQMQFHAPTIPHYPLFIKMNASQSGTTLGTVGVYIKDVQQITYEESLNTETETVSTTKKRKKKTDS